MSFCTYSYTYSGTTILRYLVKFYLFRPFRQKHSTCKEILWRRMSQTTSQVLIELASHHGSCSHNHISLEKISSLAQLKRFRENVYGQRKHGVNVSVSVIFAIKLCRWSYIRAVGKGTHGCKVELDKNSCQETSLI